MNWSFLQKPKSAAVTLNQSLGGIRHLPRRFVYLKWLWFSKSKHGSHCGLIIHLAVKNTRTTFCVQYYTTYFIYINQIAFYDMH